MVDGKLAVIEFKLWMSSDVPVTGLVKMEAKRDGKLKTMELTRSGRK
jgi:hypothetical protein